LPVAITVEGDARDLHYYRYYGGASYYDIEVTRSGIWLLLDEPKRVLSIQLVGPETGAQTRATLWGRHPCPFRPIRPNPDRRAAIHRVPTLDARLTVPEVDEQQSNWVRQQLHRRRHALTTVRRADRGRMPARLNNVTDVFRSTYKKGAEDRRCCIGSPCWPSLHRDGLSRSRCC